MNISQPHDVYIYASSDPSRGSVQRQFGASTFKLNLTQPMFIPDHGRTAVSAINAEVYNSVPNISQPASLTVKYLGTPVVIPFHRGYWTVGDVSSHITNTLATTEVLGVPLVGLPWIDFTANVITNRVDMVAYHDGILVEFSQSNSINGLLGFPADDITTAGLPPVSALVPVPTVVYSAPTIPKIQLVSHWHIGCSLSDSGQQWGDNKEEIIASFPNQVPRGVLQVYQPNNPPFHSMDYLRGKFVTHIDFSIYDQNIKPADLDGTNWGVLIRIAWKS